MHYNEFQAVKLARQLIENDDDDEDDVGDGGHIACASGDQSLPHETASSEASDGLQQTGAAATSHVLREDMVWRAW